MMDFDKTRHLDLLADAIMRKMDALCGEAVREKVGRYDVLEICGIERPLYNHEDPLNLEQIAYADGLLADVFQHLAIRWGQFRETERRLCSAAAPTYDDEGEFD
jgi:hypothetical protein